MYILQSLRKLVSSDSGYFKDFSSHLNLSEVLCHSSGTVNVSPETQHCCLRHYLQRCNVNSGVYAQLLKGNACHRKGALSWDCESIKIHKCLVVFFFLTKTFSCHLFRQCSNLYCFQPLKNAAVGQFFFILMEDIKCMCLQKSFFPVLFFLLSHRADGQIFNKQCLLQKSADTNNTWRYFRTTNFL